jgi:NADPH:quinone reductase
MRAVRIHDFGGPVQFDEVDLPSAAEGESLVEPSLVALNPLDLWVIEGSVAGGTQTLPFVLGTEGAGTVDGRRVIVNGAGLGTVRDGLLREVAAVPGASLTELPPGLDEAQAAAMSVVGVTAKRILEIGEVESGNLVIVLGASGGVGSVAIQIAKNLRATVVAVSSSPGKRAWLEELGADLVVGSDEPIPKLLNDAFGSLADVVLNPLGGDWVGRAISMLVPRGRQVLFGRSASEMASFSAAELYRNNMSILGYGGLADDPERARAARAWLVNELVRGSLRIPVEAEIPLDRAAEGLELIRRGETRGKVVVRVRQT